MNASRIDQLDEILAERLNAALDAPAHARWEDVVKAAVPWHRRLELLRIRRTPLAAAIALLVLAFAGSALAFREQVVNFLTAAHASKSVVDDFGQRGAAQAVFANSPGVIAADTRRVATTTVNGHPSTLYVAPTRSGGFCSSWTGTGRSQCLSRSGKVLADFQWLAASLRGGVDRVEGVTLRQAAQVSLRLSDGRTIAVPVDWVTTPINAGFFLYGIGTADRSRAVPSMLFVSVGGRVVSAQKIPDVAAMAGAPAVVTHEDEWGRSVQTTAEAVWGERHRLFKFIGRDGAILAAWAMPSRRSSSRRCFASEYAFGCEPRSIAEPALQLEVEGGGSAGSPALWGQVSDHVAKLELVFQDGMRATAVPRDGFVLVPIGSRHFAFNHRLKRVIGLDDQGQAFTAVSIAPRTPGVYPCARPRAFGYGVTSCP